MFGGYKTESDHLEGLYNCLRVIIALLRKDAKGNMVALYTQYGEDTVREEHEDVMPLIGL